MSSPRMPQVLIDLYRDLRDRRLLPVVAVLLVALVALPVGLSASSGAPPSSTLGADAGARVEAPETQPAVLAEAQEVRDYRKRLGELNRRNPFQQQFQAGGLSKTAIGAISAVGGSAVSGGEPSVSGGSATATAASGETASSGVSGSTSDGESATTTITKLETFRVDVRFGPADRVKKMKDVKPLDALDPVAVFVGVSDDGSKAIFFVSSEVDAASGDGACVPLGGAGCGLLVLETGEAERLDYTPDGTSYTLKLSDIKRVLVE
jgi:hypothetical protein